VLNSRYTPIEVAAFAVDSPGRDLGMREGDEIECINNIMIHGEKSLTHLKEVVGAIAQTRNRLVVMVRRRKPDPALLKQDLGELTREVMEVCGEVLTVTFVRCAIVLQLTALTTSVLADGAKYFVARPRIRNGSSQN